jgi:hypothetical protein
MKTKIFGLMVLITSNMEACTSPALLLISIPKCGTHLMGLLLGILTDQRHRTPGIRVVNGFEQIAKESIQLHQEGKFSHIHYNVSKKGIGLCKEHNICLFFIYRDPRDQIISWILTEDTSSPDSIQDRISNAIDPNKEYFWGYKGVGGLYELTTPWINVPSVCAVKFEDLVGPAGGGSIECQHATIQRVARHLGTHLSSPIITLIANELFGNTATFRQGKIGSWKQYFTQEHKELFKKYAGQLLIDLGYEYDFNW